MEMDVRHYFDAIDFTQYYKTNQSNWKYLIGAAIEKSTVLLTPQNIQKLDVAIIGVPFDSRKTDTNLSDATDKIREELYRLSKLNSELNIADFGNLKRASSKKGNYQALRDIVEFCVESEIVTIIIGGSQDLSVGICEAFKNNNMFSFSTIDAFLDVKKSREKFNSTNYLSRIFTSFSNLFQFSLIGYQRHYITPEYFFKTKGINTNIGLGSLKNDISQAEPVLRNTDVLSFDIGAIKYAEAPGSSNISPNGLHSEEACQLAKYAGMSDRLKVFGLFEYDTGKDELNVTAKLLAQIVWYFIEGFLNRQNKKPDENDRNIMYRVEVKDLEIPFVFYKNPDSNQWWMQIIFAEKVLHFACSEKEYNQASNNEIPELWVKYIMKLDKMNTNN